MKQQPPDSLPVLRVGEGIRKEVTVEDTAYCELCDEDKPLATGEDVVVDRTYVDHMLVSEDTEWLCRDCLDEAEEAELDWQLRRRGLE